MRLLPAAIASLGFAALLSVAGPASAQTAPDLGAAAQFALLSSTTVDDTGGTVVTGDVGALGAITGAPVVNGTTYPNGTGQTVAARDDAIDAYIDISGQGCDADLTGQDLGGLTLLPGVYCFDTTAQLTTTLTLDGQGDPDAVFIIRIGTTLTTAAASAVSLINGANALNVFWTVGSSATLGATTSFAGTLIATTTAGLGAGVTWTGRVITLNAAITLDSSTVTLPMQDLVTTKTTAPATVAPGGTFQYQITVTNTGTATAEGVTITDPLPSQLTFVSSTTGCTAVGQLVTCGPAVDLAPAGTVVDDILVQLDPAYTGNGSDLGNVATASSESFEPTPANNSSASAPPPTVLAPSADLSITKAPVEVTVSAGQSFTYRLVVTNAGPSTAVNVGVGDTLPVQVTFVSSPQNCAPVSGFIFCPTTAMLAPGGTLTFDIVVRLDPAYTGTGSDIVNQANVGSATADPATGNNEATSGPPTIGAATADVQIVKTASAATIRPGENFTYTLQATNNGPAVATGVSVTDTLPVQLTFVSSVAGCTSLGQAVTCPTSTSLAVAASASFDVIVQVAPGYTGNGSDISNTASVTATTVDPAPANDTSTAGAPTIDTAQADLTVAKNVDPTPVPPGGTIGYSVLITNLGPSTAIDVVTTDSLPTGLTFVSSPDGCTAVGQMGTCPTIAMLAPGDSATFTFVAQLAPSYAGNGSELLNVASVSATTGDPDLTNNSDTAASPTIAAPSADLSVGKSAIEPTVLPGQTFTYRIVAANAGPSNAAAVVVTDTLPAQLTFVSSGDGCTAAGQLVTCPAVPTLGVTGTVTFDLLVRLDAAYTGDGSDVSNVASVSSDTSDPANGDNSSAPAPAPAVGAPESDLQLTKSVSAATVTPGSTFTYTVQVVNNGPSLATNVVITDPLPAQTTFVSSLAGCTAAGQTVTCPTAATLGVGTPLSVDIVVQLDPAYTGDGTDVLNSATVATATLDPSPADNTNPAGAPPLVGAPGADVTVVKTVSTAPVTAGTTFTYALLVSNQGPSVAADVVTTDLLPAGITFVSSIGGCLAAGQQVTCPTIGAMAPAASSTFDLVVRLDPNYAGDGSDLPNRGVVSASTMDPVPGNNTSAPVTPNVGAGSADLSVLKVALGDSASPGGLFTYRVSVTNAGPSAASGIELGDALPAPLTFVASVAGCTALGQAVTCLRPTMPSGTTVDFDITVRLNAAYAGNGSDLANIATVAAATADPDASNNTTAPASPPPLGFGAADLILTKTGPAGPVVPNSEIAYSLVVTNQGPNAATGIVVQDPTPAGLTFVGTSGACVTAFPCTIGTLPAGQAATITARYTVGSALVVTNTATVSSPTPDPSPGTNTASATTPSEPRTYYLAEGATGAFWSEDISIANPNAAAAPVTMSFFTESGAVVSHTLTLAASSHTTVQVDDLPGLASTSTSTRITSESGLPLVVERTMTWDATMYGGHTETAAAELSTTWYFAEGALGYFDTFLLLGNAQATPTTATVTFLLEAAPPVMRTVSIAAHARLTLDAGTIAELNGRAFGIAVVASQPIVAERSMYFGSSELRLWSGGHSSGGVSAPSRRWFYAEGATGTFFDTFILMSNPQTVAAEVTMDYLLPNGTLITATKAIPAQGRLTVSIDREADVRLHAAAVSTRITSDVPIVTERSMYWASKPDLPFWSEGHNSFGVDQAAPRWGLAGGRIGGPNAFQTFILLANPWAAPANVTVTYVREGEAPILRTYVVPPTTRYTIDVAASAPELAGDPFGAAIAVTNSLTITVERSIYWNANGVFWTAGTNAGGTRIP